MKKKLFCLLLIAALTLSLLPAAALAEEIVIVNPELAPNSNRCGDALTWALDNEGTLTVIGTGPMWDFDQGGAPWYASSNSIVKVAFGNGVTSIGSYAFAGCGNLLEVALGSKIENIGYSAFDTCFSLKTVNLPSGLVLISPWAFAHTAIDNITLPASLEYVGSGAFAGCYSLDEVQVAAGSTFFKAVDGMLLDADGTQLLCCPAGKSGSVTVPAAVTYIEANAFYDCKDLTAVVLPEGLRVISYSAFAGCRSLPALTLPESLRSIHDGAFERSGLKSITIPAAATDVGTGLFAGCSDLTAIEVAAENPNYRSVDGVLLSKDGTLLYAFPGARTGAYRVPAGVETIRVSAFERNNNLTEVTFPASLKEIEDRAFSACLALKAIYFEGVAPVIGSEYEKDSVFAAVVATAYYPAGDASWTAAVRQNYGGTLTWVSYTPTVAAPELTLVGMSTKGVSLRWTEIPGAERYALVRVAGDYTYAQEVEATELVDNYGLFMGCSYTYLVRAQVNGTWTDYSKGLALTFNPFADVSGKKTIEYVGWAFNNEIVKGTSETKFSPDSNCSRVQFVMMLWKMHGSPEVEGTNPFSDISGAKTTKAILWALDAGVIVSAEKFRPDDPISRAEIVMILWKLAGSPEVEGESPFTDVKGAKTNKAVLWAYQNEITKGTSATTFAPNADCTRVQLVIFLYKYNGIYHVI